MYNMDFYRTDLNGASSRTGLALTGALEVSNVSWPSLSALSMLHRQVAQCVSCC